MAHGYLETQSNINFPGNFSLLEGVMVKIGDKFQSPPKVRHPAELKIIQLQELSDLFDFSFEEEIIKISKDEFDQQKRRNEEQSDVKDLSSQEAISTNVKELEISNIEKDSEDMKIDRKRLGLNNGIKKQTYSSISDAPILEPTPIYSQPKSILNSKIISEQFNLSDFEDSNATPFELVELQTLDDLDELKSLLQPESIATQERKPAASMVDEEIDFSIFNIGSTDDSSSSNRCIEEASTSTLHGIESQPNSNSNMNIYGTTQSFSTVKDIPCTLYLSNNNRSSISSSSRSPNTHYKLYNPNDMGDQTSSPSKCKDLDGISTNLTSTNSKSLPNLIDASLPRANQGTGSPPNQCEEPVLSTARIDNIMKQYQFTRLANAETNNISFPDQQDHNSDILRTDNRPVPHHPVLGSSNSTFASLTRNDVALSCNFVQSQNKKDRTRAHSTGDESVASSINSCDELSENNQEKHILNATGLPTSLQIPTASESAGIWPVTPSVVNKDLEDSSVGLFREDAVNLSTEEITLVCKIVGMGFPKAMTARAVERSKGDEKQIIDFLVQVRQIADMGYDSDDVELALLSSKSEVISYLNLLNRWKELGFPLQKIHDALKNTDKENEAVFEYLTS